MTPAEASKVRDLVARNRELDRENKRLRALLKASCTRRRNSQDVARYLHGVLIANGIKVER